MQISEIKMADIPDIDLSSLEVTKYGNFTVEVIDPVCDYLELMEVGNNTLTYINAHFARHWLFQFPMQDVFDFPLIKSLISRSDFRYKFCPQISWIIIIIGFSDSLLICVLFCVWLFTFEDLVIIYFSAFGYPQPQPQPRTCFLFTVQRWRHAGADSESSHSLSKCQCGFHAFRTSLSHAFLHMLDSGLVNMH